MELKVEIKSTEMRKQITQKGNELYWQKAGLENTGDWPLVFDVFCPDGRPYPVGKYSFLPAFKADQWGSLQINPFDSRLEALK